MLRIVSVLLMSLGLGWSLSACAEEGHSPYAVGTHYRLLDNPVSTDVAGKIEVREFFFYGCPHCYDVEPIVTEWKANKADDVHFVRTPVLFLRNAETLARAFYVAKSKGILEEVHKPLFDAIHKRREPLFSVPALTNFFRAYGVEPDEFNDLYASFGVSTKVRQAEALTREYKISGVPAFAVNGKYVVLRKNLKNDQETFEVINYLIEKERAASGQ
jgi:thiol:disulfide interchange protein DsbA